MSPTELGFDFGLSPRQMALGAFDFMEDLRAAEICGIGFAVRVAPSLGGVQIPELIVLAEKRESLEAAFDKFSGWGADSDGDAVGLELALGQDGGYRAIISAEDGRMRARTVGLDSVSNVVRIFPAYIHAIPRAGPHLAQFRDYARMAVAPFFFSGASCLVVGEDIDGSSIRPLERDPLFKLEVSISEADSNGPNFANAKHVNEEEANRQSPADVASCRSSLISKAFPVTLGRLRRRTDLRTLEGLEQWQVLQAVCNLVISNDLGSSPHYADLSVESLASTVFDRTCSRVEKCDGSSEFVDTLKVDQISHQANLDAEFLLTEFLGESNASEPDDTRSRLDAADLLKAEI